MLFYGTEGILADPFSALRIWEGRHVLPRRTHRRAGRARHVREPARPAHRRRVRFRGAAAGHRLRRRPHRQLHQRRAVGQADRRALGRHRGRHAASRVAALRGAARGPGAVRDHLVVHGEAAAALGAIGPVPRLLRPVPLCRRVRARAGRQPRLPAVRLGDDGPDPVAADDRGRAAGCSRSRTVAASRPATTPETCGNTST